jgi:PAS domain S-box-containing protein
VRPSTADRLRALHRAVLEAWERRARSELRAAREEDGPALSEQVPALLEALVVALDGEHSAPRRTETIAVDHATRCAERPEYDLRQVLGEYDILRQTVLELLEHGAVVLAPHDRDRILDVVESAKIAAAEAWVARAQRREGDAVEKLRVAEARLALAVDAAAMGVWEWDLPTDRLDWSPRLQQLFGYRPGEFPGTIGGFWARMHAHDRPRVAREIARATDATEESGDGGYAAEFRVQWPDGSIHWIAAQGRATRDAVGRVVRMTGVATEITRRVEAENELRRTLELFRYASRATQDLLWDWDLATDRLVWNEAVMTKLGFPESSRDGRIDFWHQQIHPEDRARVVASIEAAIAGRDERWVAEYRFLRADGVCFDVVDRGFVVRDADGRAVRMIGAMEDVTERKRALDALEMSERSFRTLAETMPQIVWTARADGHVDWYNQWWYDYTGTPRGTDWYDEGSPMHPDDVAPTWRRWLQSVESGATYEMEYRFRRAEDGEYRWHIGRAVPLRDGDGKIVRWIGTNTDVHDQKLLVEELRRTQERLALALDAARIGIFEYDLSSDEITLTREAALNLGFDPDRRKLRFAELEARVDPDDLATFTDLFALPAERRFRQEFRIDVAGRTRWIFATGRTTIDGKTGGKKIIGSNQDVTDRKEQEEALAQALQSVSDFKFALDTSSIVAITDPRGVITYVNDKFCEISKYDRDELLGRTHKIINSGHHPRAFFQDLWRTIASGQVWRGEIENRAKDGSFYWVDTVIVPFMKDGRPVQYIAIRNDITPRMRALEELHEERAARERFVSMLAHDLRNPLTSAKIGTQILARKADDPARVIALAAKAAASLDRADKMIQDLLDVSRIESGAGLVIELGPCDLSVIARDVGDDMRVAHGVDLRLEAPERARGWWSCNELRRLVENLVSNACKYGDRTRPITVALELRETDAVLRVHNWGAPIPPDDQQTIFQSFQRSVGSKRARGWGIGLSLVKGVVDAHGGEIRLESDEARGTTFVVCLPLDARPAELRGLAQ